uniref:Uncharacterized protein n=1 Tax=Anguilla anguilla TaxID=7936 RepID=A0A0E9XDF9_ANGAN
MKATANSSLRVPSPHSYIHINKVHICSLYNYKQSRMHFLVSTTALTRKRCSLSRPAHIRHGKGKIFFFNVPLSPSCGGNMKLREVGRTKTKKQRLVRIFEYLPGSQGS